MANVQVVPVFYKHPDAIIDIDFRIVSDDSDTVASTEAAEIEVSGELEEASVDISGAVAKLWLSGGVDNTDYEVALPIITTLGRKEIGRVTVKVRA